MGVLLYVGTVTSEGGSEGIYLYEVDLAAGRLVPRGLAAKAESPSFLAFHPKKPVLYALDQMDSDEEKGIGAVSAFAIEQRDGKLRRLNQRSTGGAGPCHVTIDPAGRTVLVANYGGGSVAAYPVFDDGTPGERSAFVQHEGSGPNSRRQKAPHAHSVNVDPAGNFALAADLGADRIFVYRLDPAGGLMGGKEFASAALAPGAGPRHLAFHPGGRWLYVINELDNTVTAFTWDGAEGRLEMGQTLGTLPDGYSGESWTAEILVHPSGRFLYGSNRGHDSIVVFQVRDDGTLEAIEHVSTGGRHPRNFGIDPTGQLLVVANRDSDNLVVFRIDPESGRLSRTGAVESVNAPVCVRFRCS